MKPKFMEAINDGDLLTIRLFLANELLLDPSGKSFEKMRSFAEMNVESLYEQHDGTVFSELPTIWDDELLFNLRNDLDSNFSSERLDFFEKVAKVVLKEKAESLLSEKKSLSEDEKQALMNSEECIPETLSKGTPKKNKLLSFIKRIFKEKKTTPYKDGLNDVNNKKE